MKIIGHTEGGDYIVTCTENELKMYDRLIEASKGHRAPYAGLELERFPSDISSAMSAVVEWVAIKDRANALRLMAEEIERTMSAGTTK